MPTVASDLKHKLSITSGSAGNAAAQPDPNQSLGKYASTTELSGTALGNLFDNVSGDENQALDTEYRALVLHNSHGSLAMLGVKVWLAGPRFTALAADDTFTANGHGLADGTPVRVEAERTGDTLPTGVNNSTTYYVRDQATNTFKLAATLGGAAINLTADGAGAVRKYMGTDESIGVDTTAASAVGASAAQGLQIANEGTAPSGVTFTSPTTKAAAIDVGDLAAGQVRFIWIRRTAVNGPATDNDGVVLRCEWDSGA